MSMISYVLFSIGNIKPLLQKSFASCWQTHEICDKKWIEATEYLEVLGIIVGQVSIYCSLSEIR